MKPQSDTLRTWHKTAFAVLSVWLICFATAPFSLVSAAVNGPQVMLEDNYNTENKGEAQINFGSFANWDVVSGQVNLKGNTKGDMYPQQGIYIELNSWSGDPVKLVSKRALALEPGRYRLQMDLGASQVESPKKNNQDLTQFFGMEDLPAPPKIPSRVQVQLGQAFLAKFNVEPGQPLRKVSVEFEVSHLQSVHLEISKTDRSRGGVLLDNLLLNFTPAKEEEKKAAAEAAAVQETPPEPEEVRQLAELKQAHAKATKALIMQGNESLAAGSLQSAEAYFMAAQTLDPENAQAEKGAQAARDRIQAQKEQEEKTVLARAVELVRKSAEKGDPQAQHIWGIMLETGLQSPGFSVAADLVQAKKWQQKAADQKYAPAAERLALLNKPASPSEEEQAGGNPDKLFVLGLKYYEGKETGKDVRKAVHYLKEASKLGHARSAFLLYELYERGEDAPQDIKTAIEWLKRSAQLGDGQAQYQWAFALLEGFEEGDVKIETDSAEGLKWLSESAKNGYDKAIQELQVIKRLVRPIAPPPAPKPADAPSGPQGAEASGSAGDRLTTEVKTSGNLVINGSFEDGTAVGAFATLKSGEGMLPGWQVYRGSIDMLGSYWPAADGEQSIDLHGASGVGSISQAIPTEPGQNYEVSFDLAGDPECGANIRRLKIEAADQSSEFAFDPKNSSRKELGWTTHKWRFRAREKKTMLKFVSLSTDNSLCGPLLDNIVVQKTGP